MKKMHLNISTGMKMLLIGVLFLISPIFTNAQITYYLGNQTTDTIATSDSRMVISIEETDTIVKLHVMILGVAIADQVIFAPLYNSAALTLIYAVGDSIVSLGNDLPNATGIVEINPSFKSSNSTFTASSQLHLAATTSGVTGMNYIKTAVGTSSTTARFINIAGKIQPVYSLCFRKNTTGVPLQTSDLGFAYKKNIARVNSYWISNGVMMVFDTTGGSDNQRVNPDMFVYRSPSVVTTHPANNIAGTSVTLNGHLLRGDLGQTNSLIVCGGTNPAAPRYTGRLNYDTITQYGFIYSLENVEITYNNFSDKLIIDGVEYNFPDAAELLAGTFDRNGNDFYIVFNDNTAATQARNYSENITGLTPDTTYYAWAVMKYAFETSETYVAVGAKDSFMTATGCIPPDVPIAISDQSFCGDATVADLVAFVAADSLDLVWYDASNAMLDPTDALADGTTYYAKASFEGCESDSVAVKVTLNRGLNAPVAVTPQDFCDEAYVSELKAQGVGIVWYDAITGGNVISETEKLNDEQIYYAAQTDGICESETRTAVKVVIKDYLVIEPPVVGTPQDFCDSATLNDIATDGSNIVWYDAATDGNILPSNTLLVDGDTYYAAKKAGECESTTRTAVSVTTGNTVIDAPLVTSPQYFCDGATIGNFEVPNNKIIWYASPTGNTLLNSNTLLVDSVIYYAAQQAGDCESTTRTPVMAIIDEASDIIVDANQSFCAGSTIADIAVTGAGIKWYESEIATSELPRTTVLQDGATYYGVQSSGICESSNRVGVTVTVKSVGTPLVISNQSFCENATVANLVAFLPDTLDLVWYNNDVIMDPTDYLIDGEIYYAKASFEECESMDTAAVAVTIIGGLNAPKVTTPQTLCPGSLVSNLYAEGENVIWYDALTGGNIVNPNNLLADGFYYAAQRIDNCESDIRSQVKVIIEEIELDAPVIASPQNFCDNATLDDIATDGSTIVWYSFDGTPLPSTTPLVNATTYYAAKVAGTCESAQKTPVLVYTGMDGFIDAPVVASPQHFCEGATIQNIAVPNNQIIWYATATGNTELSSNTILGHDVIYYAAQKAGECESTERTPVRILLENPQGPEAASPQTFCGTDFTLADLEITGAGIVWYDAATGGNTLPSTTRLTTTPTWYYAAQGAYQCESSRVGILAYVNAMPQTPVVSGDLIVCADEEIMDLTSVVETESNIIYTYYSDEGMTEIEDPQNVPVPAQDMTYYVKAMNASTECESESLGEIDVTISNPPVVSVTPAGAYTAVNDFVTLTITDNNTNPAAGAKTATILNESIASIELVNGQLKVIGKERGNTEVVYTSVNENGCTTELIIPVQVEGLPTGILTGKDIVVCSGETTATVQIAYVMGGVVPWTITVSDDKGNFSKDTVINSIEDFPVDITVVIPVNTSNVVEFVTYTITNVEDALNSSKQTHYGAVRIGVNPMPVISTIANDSQVVCSGETTLPVSFNGVATVYRWSIDKNIGLENYSEGAIPSFVAVNNTNSDIDAMIIVTPEYWYNGLVCIGEPDTAYITVKPAVNANFVATVSGLGVVNFSDRSSSNVTGWNWDFGDGNTSTVKNPTHTYTNSGIYVVELTVTTDDGCTAKVRREIKVNVTTTLNADFVVNAQTQCLDDNEFIFTDKSTITTDGHAITAWVWDFGDGNTSTAQNPSHTYVSTGTYTVTLTVTESPGNSQNSIKYTINVIGSPEITDGAVPDAVCEGEKLKVYMPTIDWKGNTPVTGQWLLDSMLFDPNTTALTVADDGKLLQYYVQTTCGSVISAGVIVSVHQTPGITLDNSVVELCDDVATIDISYTLTNAITGVDIYYTITFDADARRAGFKDVASALLSGGTITVALPASLAGGYYSGIISIQTDNGCPGTSTAAFDIYKGESIRITKQPQSAIVCETSSVTLSVEANAANLNYQWFYEGVAISGANSDEYTFNFDPSMSGEYHVEISNSCMTVTSNKVNIGNNLLTVEMKWDNVIYVNNPAFAYVSFQWYKDGTPIMKDGYGQYYSEEFGFDGTYYVRCYYADGSYVETCPVTLNTKKSTKILLYPNPAEAGSRVVLEIHTTEYDITNASLEIFDAAGKLVSRGIITDAVTEITAPMAAGIYTARVVTKSEHVFYERFVVGQ
jgi:PKD repeat protein